MSKTDQIPPVVAEGCVWMSMPARYTGSNKVAAVAILSPGGWEHIQARGWSGDVLAAAHLMRRLGPDEDPAAIEGAWWKYRRPGDWYAPVRFAGRVPDFGETGLRLVDSTEAVDEYGYVPTDQGPSLPITLPPLPKPEREEPDTPDSGGWEKRVFSVLGGYAHHYEKWSPIEEAEHRINQLRIDSEDLEQARAENVRLQARLREVEAERDELRVAEQKARDGAHLAAQSARHRGKLLDEARAELRELKAERCTRLRQERDEARAELERVRESLQHVRRHAQARVWHRDAGEPISGSDIDFIRRIANEEV